MFTLLRYLHSIFAQPGARIGRKGFLLGLIILIISIPIVAALPVYLIHHFLGYTIETFGNADLLMKLSTLGGYLVFFYFSVYCFLSIHIKRLHDLDHLGWWLLAIPLYPILLFFLMLKKGDVKENKFGPTLLH